MFKIILFALAMSFPLRQPDLIGLGTYYGPPAFRNGDVMRNGRALDLSAATMAVDTSYAEWMNREAIVLTECDGLHRVCITDTGLLKAAEKVRFGVGPLSCARYWHEDRTDIKWADGAISLPYVADFPVTFFQDEVAYMWDAYGRGETVMLIVWVLPAGAEEGEEDDAED